MTSNVRPFPPIGLRVSEIELCDWLSQAEPGETLEYHRGFLVIDRTPLGQPMCAADRRGLIRIARCVMRLAERGLIHLVQRRLAADTFSYLAIARSRRANAVFAFSILFAREAA